VGFTVDGSGASTVKTGVPFLDHMLDAMARHGYFDLVVQAKGDLAVDAHHTIEDVGLALGQAIRKALGERQGIQRFGAACIPMDDALARVVLDLSGRPCLAYRVRHEGCTVGGFDARLLREFFQALVNTGGITLHIDLLAGEEIHHIYEAVFKAFGRALAAATQRDPRCQGVPSTKGVLA
jgi:imidazoleglycerol-phosphate dehydratase